MRSRWSARSAGPRVSIESFKMHAHSDKCLPPLTKNPGYVAVIGWSRHSHMALFVAYLLSNPNIGSNNSPTKQTAGEKVVEKRETAI